MQKFYVYKLVLCLICAFSHVSFAANGPPQDNYDYSGIEDDFAYLKKTTPVAAPTPAHSVAPHYDAASLDKTLQLISEQTALSSNKLSPSTEIDLWARIRKGMTMPEMTHPLVDNWIAYYTKRPDYLSRMLNRSGRYLYYIVEEADKRNIPLEIALLPFIESAFNPQAYSTAHAAGMWQFIPSTGRSYGLEQTVWYDGRRDIYAATIAALDYLNNLYGMFGDWQLALSSYNWGEGAVGRAINKNRAANLPIDYFSLKMPNETRNYVPKLMAICEIIKHPERYGVVLPLVENRPYFTAINTSKHIDIKIAAQLAGMTEEEFLGLNPAYNLPVLAHKSNRKILVPIAKAEMFNRNLNNSKVSLLNWRPFVATGGESLEQLAQSNNITVADLKQVNRLKPNVKRLLAGRIILLPRQQDEQLDQNMQVQLPVANTPRVDDVIVADTDTTPILPKNTVESIALTPPVVTTNPAVAAIPLEFNKPVLVPAVVAPVVENSKPVPVAIQAQAIEVIKPTVVPELSREALATAAALAVQVNSKSSIAMAVSAPEAPIVLSTPVKPLAVSATEQVFEQLSHETPPVATPITVAPIRREKEKLAAMEHVAVATPASIRPVLAKVREKAASARISQYRVQKGDTLSGIASEYNISLIALKFANKLNSDVAPLGSILRIPTLAESDKLERAAALALQEETEAAAKKLKLAEKQKKMFETTRYKIKRGDTLASIADAANISVADLKDLNDLRTDVAALGTNIRIPVPPESPRIEVVSRKIGNPKNTEKSAKTPKIVRYKVKAGDTLADIAEEKGVTVAALKKANKLRTDVAALGTTLRIPSADEEDLLQVASARRSEMPEAARGELRSKIQEESSSSKSKQKFKKSR